MTQDVLEITRKWIHIADRNLLTAKQCLEDVDMLTDSVCFHCQQAAEKYLKAFLAYHQVDFPKTHSMIMLVNLCTTIDKNFSAILDEADFLTDFAVEIRYPDDWYEPTVQETKRAYATAEKIKDIVISKIPR